MEPKFQTSFIPKKPIVETVRTKSSMSLFLFISILIFLISLGITGYIYLEKQLLIQNIASNQQIIAKNKDSFDPNTIDSIIALNSRINAAKTLLNNHSEITPVYDFLQKATLKNVRFRNFNFSTSNKDSTGQSGIGIQLTGTAKDFETVASQADELGKPEWKKFIQSPTVSNFSLNSDGSVSFTFSATISKDLISYSQNNSSTVQ